MPVTLTKDCDVYSYASKTFFCNVDLRRMINPISNSPAIASNQITQQAARQTETKTETKPQTPAQALAASAVSDDTVSLKSTENKSAVEPDGK